MKLSASFSMARVRHHFTYHFWKYAVLAAVSVFAWDLIYTQTEYRPPQDKRIDIYIQSAAAAQETVDSFMGEVWRKAVPDMERVNTVLLTTSSLTDMYAVMQLTAYLAAGEGDIYMLGREDFKRFAAQGAFLALDELIGSGRIDARGIALDPGRVTLQTGDEEPGETAAPLETGLYGIPAEALRGFTDRMGIDSRGMFLSIAALNGNEDNVVAFLDALIGETLPGGAQE